MPITTRDRKLLWARAGGTCAICKSHLTAGAQGADKDVVLGEEAHIVSEEPNGPRYHPMPADEADAYANFILLCPADHKIVDEQVNRYTEQHLHDLKREHEQWVKDTISPAVPTIKIRDPEVGAPDTLQRIDTGKELMNVVAHVLMAHCDYPDLRSDEEGELIGTFFQNITDYIDIWDDIGSSGHIMAGFWLSGEIARLREAGLVVYAAAKDHIIEGGTKAPEPWPVAYMVIRRSDDEAIKDNPTDK